MLWINLQFVPTLNKINMLRIRYSSPPKKTLPPLARRLATIIRVGPAINKWKKALRSSQDRYGRLKQLVTSEEQYQQYLVILRDKVKNRFQQARLINRHESKDIFPNIDGMILLSDMIIKQFREVLFQWNSKTTKIGQKMQYYSQPLKIYSEFFNNYTDNSQKLKEIGAKYPLVRKIVRQIGMENSFDPIDELYSKPFQRPMKYHILLKQYCSKIYQNHPDFPFLKKAIEEYKNVMLQNNFLKEEHEKSHTLNSLDAKFGNIIESCARDYVCNYDGAFWLDMPIRLYLFSNMVLLVHGKLGIKQFMRICLDKYSYVEATPDFTFFKNRLYFYGSNCCVHLTFQSSQLRDQVAQTIRGLINELYEKQIQRDKIIKEWLSNTWKMEKKQNWQILSQPQLVRPINAEVLGIEKRSFGEDDNRKLFVVEFYAAYTNMTKQYTPHHVSLIEQNTLIQLESHLKQLYPGELKCPLIMTLPKSMIISQDDKISSCQRLEIKTIFVTLFINSLFRNPQISKRIDYVMHRLQISDSIWNFLKVKNQRRRCSLCNDHPSINNYKAYFEQINRRQMNKLHTNSYKRPEYCGVRTIVDAMNFTQLPPQLLSKACVEQKIVWVKSTLGKINHFYSNTKPDQPIAEQPSIQVIMRGCPRDHQYSVKCNLHGKAGQVASKIMDYLSAKFRFNLQDYILMADVNGEMVVLDDDESLINCKYRQKQPENVIQFLSAFFIKKEETPVTFYLEKYWTIFEECDYMNGCNKMEYQIQSIMKRLSTQQIRVDDQTLADMYALYLCKQQFDSYKYLNQQKLANLTRAKIQYVFSHKMNEKRMISELFKRIERYKNDFLIRSPADFGIRIIRKASKLPGWSCYLIDAFLLGQANQQFAVKVGCDLQGLKVRQKFRANYLLDLSLEDESWNFQTKGDLMIISQGSKVYNLKGKQIWKVRKQIQFYQLYRKSFE